MLAFLILFALLALPIAAAAVSGLLARQSLSNANGRASLVLSVPAWCALVGAWLWYWVSPETLLGGWSSSSLLGAPLSIGSSVATSQSVGGAASVVALATVLLLFDTHDLAGRPLQRILPQGILMLGATLAFLGTSAQALLIGMSLMCLSALWRGLESHPGERVLHAFLPQCIGVLIAGLALSLNVSQSGSHLLEAMRDKGALTPVLVSAAVCLFARAPIIRALHEPADPEQHRAGILCAFALLAHEPRLETWAVALLLIGTLIWALLAITASTASRQHICLFYAGACLFLASTVAGAPWMAAVMWLLTAHLINAPYVPRLIALAIVLGLPLPAGFAIWSAMAPEIAKTGLVVGASLNAVLFVAAGLHLACWLLIALPVGSTRAMIAASLREAVRHPASLIVTAHALLFGLGLSLLGGPTLASMFRIAGLWGWAHLVATLLIGLIVWRLVRRTDNDEVFAMVNIVHARADAVSQLLGGALGRARVAIRTVFTLLESDGALLWACLVTIVAVLIARAGTP